MPPTFTPPPQDSPTDFGTDLKNVAQVVRSALSELISSTGLDPLDPQTLTKKWGVNKALSWKISKVVQTDDPFLAMQQLPGRGGVEILLKTGQKVGAGAKFIRAAREAVEQFESFVKLHCGDRNTFDVMGNEVSPIGRQQREEGHRKQLFLGMSAVWGVQARLHLNMRFVAPNASRPENADIACVAGLLDFRRLRENMPWVMTRRQINRDDGTIIPLSAAEPIDARSAGQVVPLMPEFCSQPLPTMDVIRTGNVATVELAPGPIGNAGVLSYMAGVVERSISHVGSPTNQFGDLWAVSSTPAELLIFDIFIHKAMAYAIPPKVLISSLVGPLTVGNADHARYQLPCYEPLLDLGAPTQAPVTPDVPRYAELVHSVFRHTAWSPSDFRGFRLKMAYPPIPAGIIMRYPLPMAAS